MGSSQSDPWDEVWAEYDALHPRQAPLPAAPPGRRRLGLAGLGLLLGGAVALAVPVQPMLAMARLGMERDPAALILMLTWPAVLPVSPGPRAPAGLPYLQRLSEALAEGAQSPGAMRRVLAARHALPPQRDPLLLPLDRMWLMRIDGMGRATVALADAAGTQGFRLELAWRGGAWHVLHMAPLDQSGRPVP